jgi:hypothetical protein
MEKLLISAIILGGFACGPMGEPKQAWDKPKTTESTESSAAPYTPEPPAPAKEPSHEDVCRKMWSLIAKDAEAQSKKNPKAKVPGDKQRSEFLQDCYASGKSEAKSNPEKYSCQRKCIIDAEELGDVEKCGKGCK